MRFTQRIPIVTKNNTVVQFDYKNNKTTKTKNNVACKADSGLLVVFSAPRSVFLAYFQPAGASRSLQSSRSTKTEKTQCVNVVPHVAWVPANKWGFLEFFEKVVSKALST